jgi:hypothetical protein
LDQIRPSEVRALSETIRTHDDKIAGTGFHGFPLFTKRLATCRFAFIVRIQGDDANTSRDGVARNGENDPMSGSMQIMRDQFCASRGIRDVHRASAQEMISHLSFTILIIWEKQCTQAT